MRKRAAGMNKKSIVSLAAAVSILALLLTSCGGSGQKEQSETGTPEETVEVSEETEVSDGENEKGTEEAATETAAESEEDYRELTPEEILALYEPADEKVTMMIYMTGSDLESSAAAGTNDMKEMAESGIDLSRVNLLVYTGGAPTWHSENPEIPADANALYHLTENGYEQVKSFEQLSMGDPESLTRFLAYGYENYPADSYDLILWDHGNGPVIGYGSDKQFGGDSLTLLEMKEALEASPFGEENHLALIGFDACLMSSAELACIMDDFADYLVASQETEPSFGWNYDFLGVCGKIRTEDVAREIVREYSVFCRAYFAQNEFFQSDVTLAVIDLSHAKELEQAIDSLFQEASADVSGDYSKLAVARVHTHGFGRASTGSEYDLVDIESLAKQMEEKYPDQVQMVREALAKSVVTSEANIGESCGLSLFYPYYNKNYYKKTWKEIYQELDAFPSYSSYLSRFDQVWLGTDLMDVFDETLTVEKGDGAGTYTMQLTPEQEENYASSRYYILRRISDNLYTVVYSSSDITDKKGLLTANFDGNVIYFSDDYGSKGIPFTRMYETIDSVTDYVCFPYAERPPEDPDEWLNERLSCEIQFAVDKQTKEVTVKGIYENTEDEEVIESGKRQPVDLSEWTMLSFYEIGSRYLTRDDQGRVLPFMDWPRSDWISYYEMHLANGLHFSYEPLYDDGSEYFIMFEVSDVQDNQICSELLPITLSEAPPEELSKDAVEIEWKGGDAVEILNEEGVTAEICVMYDDTYRKTYYMMHTVNENEFGVNLTLSDIYVNDTISYRNVGRNTFDVYLDPGEESYDEIEDIDVILAYAGLGAPESLQYTLELSRMDNGGYLVYDRPYHVTVTDEITPVKLFLPVMGARAEAQVLGEVEGIRAELLSLGKFVGTFGLDSDYNEFTVKLKFTNTTEEEKTPILVGMEINGIYFDKVSGCVLKPGESWLTTMLLDGEDIRTIDSNYAKVDRGELLTEISEVNILVACDGEISTFPVVLEQKGKQEPFTAEGDLLYEDEEVRILLESYGIGKEYDETEGYYWELWIENKTNRYRNYYIDQVLEDGSENYLASTNIGPGCKQFVQVFCPLEEIAEGEIKIYLESQSENFPSTGQFTLPRPD